MTAPEPDDALRTLAPRLALLAALAAEDGHVTNAAARIGVPQPTASRWIAALGRDLGVPVLAAHGRGAVLTPAGRHLADAARRAGESLAGGLRLALAEANAERNHVAFGFLHTMGGVRAPELLRGFRAAHPDVRFTLSQGAHAELCAAVADGSVDLALTAPQPAGDAELRADAVFAEPLVLLVPRGHRLARRNSVRLATVAHETFVGLKPGYGMRTITDELCAAAGFTPEPAFAGEDVETVRGLVAAGLGVALLPAAEHPHPGTAQLPLRPAAVRRIGLVRSARRPLPPAAALFREHVLAAGMR